MFQDVARFGRINSPKYCRKQKGNPSVGTMGVRRSRALDGRLLFSDYALLQYNLHERLLAHLSASYPAEYTVLVCDGVARHKSGVLKTFLNIDLVFIPAYTSETNPIEQIWKGLRGRGFRNESLTIAGESR